MGACIHCCQAKSPKALTARTVPETGPKAKPLASDGYFSKEEERLYAGTLHSENQPVQDKPFLYQLTQSIISIDEQGTLKKAINLATGQPIAVKQVPLGFKTNSGTLEEMQAEVELLTQLQHPNLVRYLGSEVSDEFFSIFMDLESQNTIGSLYKTLGPFPEPLIKNYARQVLRGLECFHVHGLMHREIKGTRVLLTSDGVCKLSGFGYCRQSSVSHGNFKQIQGSFMWMAPELLKGTDCNRFSDIWSFGCLVIEMATAQAPWAGCTPMAIYKKVCNSQELPNLGMLSAAGQDFVKQCFKRVPHQRANVRALLAHPFVQDDSPMAEPGWSVGEADARMTGARSHFNLIADLNQSPAEASQLDTEKQLA